MPNKAEVTFDCKRGYSSKCLLNGEDVSNRVIQIELLPSGATLTLFAEPRRNENGEPIKTIIKLDEIKVN